MRAVARIKAVLNVKKLYVNLLPERLDNGSCDGEIDEFVFGDKCILGFNVRKADLYEIACINRTYYRQYGQNMIYENLTLDIFNGVIKECITLCGGELHFRGSLKHMNLKDSWSNMDIGIMAVGG